MAGKDQELVIEEELSRKGSDVNEFVRMFDEAEQLFVLLDPHKSGEVSIDDFVKGCVRMKGGAKSVDIQTLLFQNKAMMDDLKKMHDRLHSATSRKTAS